MVVGVLAGAVVVSGTEILGRQRYLHTLIAAAMLAIVGAQIVQLGLFARAYAAYHLGEHDPLFDRLRSRSRLEHGLVVGGAMLATGLVLVTMVVVTWAGRGFGELREEQFALAGLTLAVLRLQTAFGAFFLSILGLAHRQPPSQDRPIESVDPVESGAGGPGAPSGGRPPRPAHRP